MRLLVKVGYEALLFAPNTNLQTLTDISNAQIVEEEGPYNQRVWKIKDNAEVEVKLVSDTDIRLPEQRDENSAITELLKLAEEKNKLQSEIYTLKGKLASYEKAAGSLVAAASATKTADEEIPF